MWASVWEPLFSIFFFLQRLKPLPLQILLTLRFVLCRPRLELTRTAPIGSQCSSPWSFSKLCLTTPCLPRGCRLGCSPCFFHLRHQVSRALWMLLPSGHGLSGSLLTYSWQISSVIMLSSLQIVFHTRDSPFSDISCLHRLFRVRRHLSFWLPL